MTLVQESDLLRLFSLVKAKNAGERLTQVFPRTHQLCNAIPFRSPTLKAMVVINSYLTYQSMLWTIYCIVIVAKC